MNTWKQFWTLFRFQSATNPFIYFMLVAFSAPILIKFTSNREFHPTLESLLSNQNLFFVGIIGVMLVAPDVFRFGAATNPAMVNGTEFLVTRATDRRLVYRARILLFYLLILVIPLSSYLYSLSTSDLKITEFHQISQQAILVHVPESRPAPSSNGLFEVVIGHGQSLLESWHVWMFLLAALFTQFLILLVQTLKYGRFLFWGAYAGVILIPLLSLESGLSHPDRLSSFESGFLFFASHRFLIWTITFVALLLGELICERHFERMEQ